MDIDASSARYLQQISGKDLSEGHYHRGHHLQRAQSVDEFRLAHTVRLDQFQAIDHFLISGEELCACLPSLKEPRPQVLFHQDAMQSVEHPTVETDVVDFPMPQNSLTAAEMQA